MKRYKLVILAALLVCTGAAANNGLVHGEPRVMGVLSHEDAALMPIDTNVQYGMLKGLDLPKTVLFSININDLTRDAKDWPDFGVQAFFLDFVISEWSDDIWGVDGKPWTIGDSDETLQKARAAVAAAKRSGSDVFLKMCFAHELDWFDDIAWQRIDSNFQQFAIFAREARCTGVAIDIEYIDAQYSYLADNYDYQGYTRNDLYKKVCERMTRVMGIMYDEFPEMVFLTFPECGLNLGTAIHESWIEEAARRDAPGGVHYCMETTYRTPDIRWMLANAATYHKLFHLILSDTGWAYWQKRCSLAIGVWPFGDQYSDVKPGVEFNAFRQGYAGSLMLSARYNWLYGCHAIDQLLGRDLDQYDGTPGLAAYLNVIQERKVITNQRYVKLARELREMHDIDTSAVTGLAPSVRFVGPDDIDRIEPLPADFITETEREKLWQAAVDYYRGGRPDVQVILKTQTEWMLIGPFPNPDPFVGHDTVYPPETEINFNAKYDGLGGQVGWCPYKPADAAATVNLRSVMEPGEYATAYALCYVTSPSRRKLQARFGANDAGKLWLGGTLVFDSGKSAQAIVDDRVVDIVLPKGKTPILFKISNGLFKWAFVFRITEPNGTVPDDLVYTLE